MTAVAAQKPRFRIENSDTGSPGPMGPISVEVADAQSGAIAFAVGRERSTLADDVSIPSGPNDAPERDQYVLTPNSEQITGTSGDDLFLAPPGSLGQNDRIDGGDGIDTIQLTAPGTLSISTRFYFSYFRNIEIAAGSFGNDDFEVWEFLPSGLSTIDGGDGFDTIRGLQPARGCDLTRLTLVSIEAIEGPGYYRMTASQLDNLQLINYAFSITFVGPGTFDLSNINLIGENRFFGTSGDDTFIVAPGSVFSRIQPLQADQGIDTLQLSSAGVLDVRDSYIFNFERLSGSSGDDTFVIRFNQSGFEIAGGDGADTVRLGDGGGAYNATNANWTSVEGIEGGAGNDSIIISAAQAAGFASISGGAGSDDLRISTAFTLDLGTKPLLGFESLTGSAGDEVVITSADLPTHLTSLDGGAGVDTIRMSAPGALSLVDRNIVSFERIEGSAGDDVVTVGGSTLAGLATISGGGGSDTLSLTQSGSLIDKTITGFETITTAAGGVYEFSTANLAGVAVVDGQGGSRFSRLDLSTLADDVTFSFGTPSQNGVVDGTVVRGFIGGVIRAGSGDDSLTGGSVSFQLFGGTGDDRLDAGTGFGGGGVLDGGADEDTLVSTAALRGQKLWLYGGRGVDLAVIDRSGFNASLSLDIGAPSLATTLADGTFIKDVERLSFTAGSGNDTIAAGAYEDTLSGGGGADVLDGRGGDDVLDGGTGVDAMTGGAGADVYYVDDARDVVLESAGGGADTVRASTSYALADFVENLELLGRGALNGAGNGLANVIRGNDGRNLLRGEGGTDTLFGGAGRDTLDGGAGADTMSGGAGDDSYVVDHAGDRIVETAGGGVDVVRSSVTFSLAGKNLENLTLTGDGDVNGTGNSLANALTGNSGDNVLSGGAGADAMAGGAGDDVYIVDDVGDRVVERLGGGSDTVKSSVGFSLEGQNLETLRLTGAGDVAGTGNGLANVIIGNAGRNVLDGRGGGDALVGDAGRDIFAFSTALGPDNVDVISGFSVVDDTIRLDDAVFRGLSLGALSAEAFVVGRVAADAQDRIIYTKSTGYLLYDRDGSGDAFEAVRFARIGADLDLASADFLVA